jgi:hypothetical protein
MNMKLATGVPLVSKIPRTFFLLSTMLSVVSWSNRRWRITLWNPTCWREIRHDAIGDDMDDFQCFVDGAPTLHRGGSTNNEWMKIPFKFI